MCFKTWPSGVPLGMNRRYSTMDVSIHLVETSSVGWSRSISRPTPRHCRSGHQSADCGTGSSVPDGTELCKKVSSCNAADVASSRIRRELPGSSSVYASGWLTGEISGAQHYTLLCGVAVADASVAVMGVETAEDQSLMCGVLLRTQASSGCDLAHRLEGAGIVGSTSHRGNGQPSCRRERCEGEMMLCGMCQCIRRYPVHCENGPSDHVG